MNTEQSIVYTAGASAVIIALMLAWIAFSLIIGGRVEKIKSIVLEKGKSYEIREYEKHIVAETEVSGNLGETLNKGFEILAGYIFGKNAKRESIPMTTPVTYEKQGKSEKIEMTVPVSQEYKAGSSIISFVMPSKYSLETLPTPNDPTIKIRVVEKGKVAVKSFRGTVSQEKLLHLQKEFVRELDTDKIEMISGIRLAQYDPPFTLPSMRRNELMVDIA